MTTADTLLDGLVDQVDAHVDELLAEHGDGDWREEPAEFEFFVESKEHLNLPPLYPRQKAAALALLGGDPKLIFEEPERAVRAYQVAVLLWGKGSGKDYLCSIIVCYCVHVLLCLRDPQRYFGFAPGEPVDVVNVAYSADQAKRVFFTKLKARIRRWRWLEENYNVFESGRRIGKHIPGRLEVQINDSDVVFPRDVRCASRHAQNESYEGLNILVWLMDEASAFLSQAKRENAEGIHQTLRTSAGSRFKRRWIGFIISYPRHADDFTMTKLGEAERYPDAGLYGDGPAATWVVNEGADDEEKVEVAPGHYVPVSLANDYQLDYEEAKARYECDPPAAVDALIKAPDRLWAAVAKGKPPLIEWEPIVTRRTVQRPDGELVEREFAGVRITKIGKIPKGTRMFFHGDPAYSSDAFALCFGHGVPATVMRRLPAHEVLSPVQLAMWEQAGKEPEDLVEWEVDVQRTVIDALIVWRPDPRRKRQVDLLNVKEVLLDLTVKARGVSKWRIGAGTFDNFESAETVQTLAAKRVPVENEAWGNPLQVRIFKNARSCFYNDLVTLPDTDTITSTDPVSPGVLYELERVQLIEDRKVDHPEGGSKDLADAVVRVIEHVTADGQARLAFGTVHGHEQAQPRNRGRIRSEQPTVDPNRTRSPATPALRDQEQDRLEERPLGNVSTDDPPPARKGLAFRTISR